MSGELVPGLYGKLPAHGDFVRRGWADEVVDRLDDWLAAGLAGLRARWGEEAFSDRMRAAPAWFGLLPGGMVGAGALFLALAPSVDRTGRYFFLAAGVAGEIQAVADQAFGTSGFAERLDAALYDAMAGRIDADGLLGRIGRPALAPTATALPAAAAWWPLGTPTTTTPTVTSAALDASLIARLFDGEGW